MSSLACRLMRFARQRAFLARSMALDALARRRPPDPREVQGHNDFLFRELGVAKDAAETRCRELCRALDIPWSPKEQSVHYVAFAALALSGFRPANILELGTYRGEATEFLATLFPEAQIVTVDLPEDDPILALYRMDPATAASRDRRLAHGNIRGLRINTSLLWSVEQPDFDLIWCDAGHHYPEVAWDHFHCLARLRPGGWMFSDDIRLPDNRLFRGRTEMFDAFRVTEYYNQRLPYRFRYLLKREDPVLYVKDRKYVACLRKPAA